MKKRFTRILAAVALLVGLTIPMGVWADEASFAPSNFSGQGTSGTGSAISATVDDVTFACDKGYGGDQIRCYKDGTITISSSKTITGISFAFSGSYNGGMETSYTGLSTTSWTKVLSSQARITACTVTYTTGGSNPPSPTPQGGTDELTNDNTIGETTSTYTDWTTSAFTSGAVYKGNSAGSNGTIQLRTTNSNSGIVSTTSGGKVTKVVVTWNSSTTSGRTLDIYGKNSAYEAPTDLYNSSKQGTKLGSIVYGTSTTLNITGDYEYIGLRSNSGAMYLDQIAITWGSASSLSAPAISPTQLTFVDSQEISITAPEGALVRYTLDGTTEPTSTTGTLYTEPFTISNTTTVKAIAYTETVTSEVTTATYTRVYTITLNQTTGGTISGPAQAAANDIVNLTATPNVGYTFDSWNSDDVTIVDNQFTMPNNNVTVSATFTASTTSYTVSFSVNNKVEMTATTFGGSIDLTKFVAEAQGYQFNGWSETATGNVVANPDSYTPQADVTLYAQFGEIVSSGYTLVTNVNQLKNGDQVVIAANGSKNVAMSTTQNTNNRGVAIITKNNDNTISFDEEGDITGAIVCQFTLEVSNNNWAFYDPVNEGYIYAASSSANNLKTQNENDANGEWNIVINNNEATITAQGSNTRNILRYNSTNDIFSCYASGQQTVWLYTKPAAKATRDVEATSKVTGIAEDVLVTVKNGGIVYLTGSNAGNEANLVVEDGGQLVSSSVAATMLKAVAACVYNNENNAGYVLIASPLGVAPTAVTNMTSSDYDLYAYYGNEELEWQNYKAGSFSNLGRGRGYLYANGALTTLEFAGNINANFSGINNLNYEDENTINSLNLVGNPFAYDKAFSVYDSNNNPVNANYLSMNDAGNGFNSGIISTSITLNPMQAIFVQANAASESFKVYTAPGDGIEPAATTDGFINLSVSRNRGNVIDNAIVRFGEGLMLNKFRINQNVTELYVTMGGNDYSIVNTANDGEMPVSFKAENNGTYTLSAEIAELEMNYLHLIDNLTGMDVDLLQTPSYTFEAKTSDYASRFRLVFKANGTNENNAETFAYFNGTNWTVSNVGEATLQVVDVTGRTVANQMINGNAELNLNQPAGVYVIRLVNGDNVKTQKVVVR